MQRWARLEQAMDYWFQWLAEIPENRARAIFYSAKNFAGRSDILVAVIPYAKPDDEYRAFVRAAIKKARQYNSFRNAVTHGEAIFDTRRGSLTFGQYVLAEGRDSSFEAGASAVSTQRIDTSSENVRELAKLMFDVLGYAGVIPGPTGLEASPQRCREQVQSLPSRADSIQQGQSRPVPRPPPSSSSL
jgi:hypothetical protein